MKNFNDQLDAILKKYKEIENQLSNQAALETNKLIELNKEYFELTSIVEAINKFNDHKQDLLNLNELLKDNDSSIREMAEVEIKEKKDKLKLIEDELLKSLIPKDANDSKNSILEIRAGTGGDEASLFAADLFMMY